MNNTFYNELDPKAAAWLRELARHELITPGVVNEQSIVKLRGSDLDGYRRVHLFAGISGWDYALRLAGWPADEPVWTGSCPCQPFSAAGKRLGEADERHLWPEMLRLIAECHPPVVFGEQVASSEVVGTQLEAAFVAAVQRGDYAKANKLAKRIVASGSLHYWRRWVDGVRADLEAEGYAFGFRVLGAHSVGSPHIRLRLFWVADGTGGGFGEQRDASLARRGGHADERAAAGGLADAGRGGDERELQSRCAPCETGAAQGDAQQRERRGADVGRGGTTERLGHSEHERARAGVEGIEGQSRLGGNRPAITGATGGLVYPGEPRPQGHAGNVADWDQPGRERTDAIGPVAAAGGDGYWSDFDIVWCRDPRGGPDIPRRIEPGAFPLAHGVPARVVRLRGYGNAIVPQVAARFICAYLDVCE